MTYHTVKPLIDFITDKSGGTGAVQMVRRDISDRSYRFYCIIDSGGGFIRDIYFSELRGGIELFRGKLRGQFTREHRAETGHESLESLFTGIFVDTQMFHFQIVPSAISLIEEVQKHSDKCWNDTKSAANNDTNNSFGHDSLPIKVILDIKIIQRGAEKSNDGRMVRQREMKKLMKKIDFALLRLDFAIQDPAKLWWIEAVLKVGVAVIGALLGISAAILLKGQ